MLVACSVLDRLAKDLVSKIERRDTKESISLSADAEILANDVLVADAAISEHRRTCSVCDRRRELHIISPWSSLDELPNP